MIRIAHDQITTWLKTISSHYDKRQRNNFMELIFMELKKADPVFANLELLSQELQLREPFTFRQSVSGILGFLEKKGKVTENKNNEIGSK
ncbi:MAG TPA: hypothetical protein ENI29_18840 [bacterium]|nr:hypothetical protein [bacterium]